MSQYVTTRRGAASGLSDDERRLLLGLAADTIATRDGIGVAEAAAQLDQAAARATLRRALTAVR